MSTTEVSINDLSPAGASANYVSPTRELRIRARCTRTANFFASGEVMKISYVKP